MKAERLIELYDRIREAPDAVSRLRRFVLDLAVRGKLVEQDPEDEPASKLLEQIATRKASLLKAGEIRKSQVSIPPVDEDSPFPLPYGWAWSQIAELGVISPRNDAPDDQPVSFVPMTMIASQYGAPHQQEQRSWGDIKKGYTHFADGDVALAKITPCFENGKSTVFRDLIGGIGAGTTELHILRPLSVNPDYLLLFLKSPHFIETGISRMTGTAGQKRVPKDYFANSPFPLPPVAEQHRIVAKVDELMALCDRLEEQHRTRETTRDRLTTATLSRLTAPDTDEQSFRDQARFALDTLPAITARPDQIKSLRQTVLDLAVRGKLVEQDPADEPAAQLVARIVQEEARSAMSSSKKARRTGSPDVGEQDLPFFLPNGWHPVRLGSVIHLISGQHLQPPEYSANHGDGPPYITGPADFSPSGLRIKRYALVRKAVAQRGQLLLTVKGSGVGKTAICDLPEVAISRQLMALTPLAWSVKFLSLITHRLAETLQESARSLIPGIGREDVNMFAFGMPPLAEQERIVAKVDELMALCDRLEACLQQAAHKRARLLESLLAEAISPVGEALEVA